MSVKKKNKKDKHFISERVITESEKNKKVWSSHERFIEDAIKNGLLIEDVFGRLEKKSENK